MFKSIHNQRHTIIYIATQYNNIKTKYLPYLHINNAQPVWDTIIIGIKLKDWLINFLIFSKEKLFSDCKLKILKNFAADNYKSCSRSIRI